ncbi:MAG: SDR family NAD(P)-dependent oxidoreductase [Nanoarchaeota archaeon]|nr:SDR family NAD(P)-dependent oxidoreductase [Nanoarchaeota archaeon]
MNLKGKTVLVTGAAGFIGSHLVEALLEKGVEVSCFIKYNSRNDWGFLEELPDEKKKTIKVITGDIRDSEIVRHAAKDVDVIFHLAALIGIPYSYTNPKENFMTNVMGTYNVMQAALDNGVKKVVHTSTSEVYGTPDSLPITEEHKLKGQSPYSASKIGADKVAESFYHAFGLQVAIARPFNTYGPRQSARAVIPSSISQALKNGIIKYGSGEPTRDLNFVADTVAGMIKIAECDKSAGEVINLGSGKEISMLKLMDKIAALTGKNIKIMQDPARVRPAKSEVLRLCADNSKAKRIIGWEPKIDLDTGLKMTIEWVSTNLKKFKTDIYNR